MSPDFTDEDLKEKKNAFYRWFDRYGFDYDRLSEQRWAIHRAHPNVTLEQYRSRLLHRFGQIVSEKTIIYLDLKYWINLRKVVLRQRVDSEYVELYSMLTKAVESGVAVCPLSYWIFQELLKQNDFESRHATTQLIDLLSNSVAFMQHGEVVAQEVLHFIRKHDPKFSAFKDWPIRECIWTRTMSFLGDQIPVWPGTDIRESDQLLVQKNLEDLHFFIPLEELLNETKVIPPDFLYAGYNVEEINRRKEHVLAAC